MQAALNKITDSLRHLYPENEVKSLSRFLMSAITGLNYTDLLVNKNTTISDKQMEMLHNYLLELQNFRPIQYVLGETEFCGLQFKLNDHVLIPRQETEELIEWILADNPKQGPILDIGCGSGCIAISLKYFNPHCEVFGCDISLEALEVARNNAELSNLEVHFFHHDILKEEFNMPACEIIVSNPPYIPMNEKQFMHQNVLNFEPHLALFVPDNDPLLFYKRIAEIGLNQLTANGKLYFEVHRDYAEKCCEMLTAKGYKEVLLKKDIHDNNRMVKASTS